MATVWSGAEFVTVYVGNPPPIVIPVPPLMVGVAKAEPAKSLCTTTPLEFRNKPVASVLSTAGDVVNVKPPTPIPLEERDSPELLAFPSCTTMKPPPIVPEVSFSRVWYVSLTFVFVRVAISVYLYSMQI